MFLCIVVALLVQDFVSKQATDKVGCRKEYLYATKNRSKRSLVNYMFWYTVIYTNSIETWTIIKNKCYTTLNLFCFTVKYNLR